jgi:P4 family phage/plasmid primase-like protien
MRSSERCREQVGNKEVRREEGIQVRKMTKITEIAEKNIAGKRTMRFVSRIRGARDVHEMTCEEFQKVVQRCKRTPSFTLQEYLDGEDLVSAFYDWDRKLKELLSDEDLDLEKKVNLRDLRNAVSQLHPGCVVLYAERHGELDPEKAGGHVYKISYRAYVRDVVMRVRDIPDHVRRVLGLGAKATHKSLDLSVYKAKEQLLGVPYACKDIDRIKRYLIPLDESIPASDFLVQNVRPGAKELSPGPPQTAAVNAAEKTAGKKGRGRPKKIKDGLDQGRDLPERADQLATKPDHRAALRASSEFFGEKFRLHDDFTSFQVDSDKRRLRLKPEEKWCFIRRGRHASNNQFINIDERGARYCCHDEDCRKAASSRADLLIPFGQLPGPIQEAFATTFPEDEDSAIDKEMLEIAKTECQANITDTWPRETGLDIRQKQAMLTAWAKEVTCTKCSKIVEFRHCLKGLRLHCECGAAWPSGYIAVPEERYQTLQQTLLALQVNVGMVVNGDVTIHNYGRGDADDLSTYEGDGLVVFENPDWNAKMLVALAGTDAGLSDLVFTLFVESFHCAQTGTKGTEGMWYHFRDHHWVSRAELELKALLATDVSFLTYFKRASQFYERSPMQTEDMKKKARAVRRLCEQLGDGGRRKRILDDAIIRFHKYRPDFTDRLDTANMLVFTNGVMDLTSGDFRDGHPEDYLSIRLTIPYQPLDTQSADCAYVMDFLTAIQPDAATRDYLLTVLSLCISTDTSMQYFWIFTGGGANGKSKLMNLLRETLGQHFGTAPATLLTRRREDANQANEALSSLQKARVAVFSEGAASEVLQNNTLKLFSGEDTLTTRGLHEKQQEWKPFFKCIMVCNDIPTLDDNSWAAWRRIKVVSFPTSFVDDPNLPHERKKDTGLGEKLSRCATAFMSILVHFFLEYKRVGSIQEPAAVQAATERYKTENDVFEEFREEYLVQEDGARLDWKEGALPAFRKWAQTSGKRIPKATKEVKAMFVAKLGPIYDSRFKGTSLYGWRHVRLAA